MTKSGKKLIDAASEALAIARGDEPAASITYNGHRYVSSLEIQRLYGALLRIIARSHNGELGSSKVLDMRRIAEDALEGK